MGFSPFRRLYLVFNAGIGFFIIAGTNGLVRRRRKTPYSNKSVTAPSPKSKGNMEHEVSGPDGRGIKTGSIRFR